MPTQNPTDQTLANLMRGVDTLYTEADLRRKLALNRPLRIKLGMDPTAPDIHLGHTVVLRKMRQFQDLGHKAVLIIGDYTARIGDPTGRDTTRPVLSEEQIKANAQTYLDQAGLILDLTPQRFELRYNSEWLGGLSFIDVLGLTGQFTVQQMLHRDNFKKRMEAGKEIILSEFMYPLMQAYDSVIVEADVELGGTDQTFNNLRGRDLMQKIGPDGTLYADNSPRHPQVVMVMPLLVGLDGSEKMGKSKNNYVAVLDEPNNMFGKLMSIPDHLMRNYAELLTDLPTDRIDELVDADRTHPRQAKDELARTITAGFHDEAAADEAAAEFKRRFSEGALPTDLERKSVTGGEHSLIDVMVGVGFAQSKGEARRLIAQGGVSWAGEKITDPQATITITADPVILKVGKRRVCEVIAE